MPERFSGHAEHPAQRYGKCVDAYGHPHQSLHGSSSQRGIRGHTRHGFQFSENGWQQFSNGGMNMHGALHHRVLRLRIHQVQNTMDYFVAARAKDRSSQYLLAVAVHGPV
jgi:hypothetical protein